MRTLFTLIASLAGVLVVAVTTAQNRPNILWIISEDTSCDIGCYGNTTVRTPNLDKLATVNLADYPEYQKTRSTLEAVLNIWIEEIDDKGFRPDSPEVQKHFIDTRRNDKEKYRASRLKGYLKTEKYLKSAGKI